MRFSADVCQFVRLNGFKVNTVKAYSAHYRIVMGDNSMFYQVLRRGKAKPIKQISFGSTDIRERKK